MSIGGGIVGPIVIGDDGMPVEAGGPICIGGIAAIELCWRLQP